jgi:hypothetical protein
MNPQQQEEIVQKIMGEIHRLVQKLKEGGMNVDSTIETVTSLVDDTVKYTDRLTISGTFEKVRFDTRTPEQVKASLEEQKQAIEAQRQEVVSKLDEAISVVVPTAKK